MKRRVAEGREEKRERSWRLAGGPLRPNLRQKYYTIFVWENYKSVP
jgi:hypothetical protein